VASGTRTAVRATNSSYVHRLESADDGALLVSAHGVVCRVARPGQQQGPPLPRIRISNGVLFLGDGATLALAGGNEVRLVNLLTGAERTLQTLLPPGAGEIEHLAASADGKTIAAAKCSQGLDKADRLVVWSLPDGKPRVLPLRGKYLQRLALSPD